MKPPKATRLMLVQGITRQMMDLPPRPRLKRRRGTKNNSPYGKPRVGIVRVEKEEEDGPTEAD